MDLGTRFWQIIMLVAAAGLLLLIFFVGKNNPTALAPDAAETSGEDGPGETITPPDEMETMGEQGGSSEGYAESFENFLDQRKTELEEPLENSFRSLKNDLEETSDSASIYNEIAGLFEDAEELELAGYYYEEYAEHANTEESWEKAGENYFKAQKVAGDTAQFDQLVERSINAFENVLEINPDNLDAKAEKAIAYYESDKDAVEGIGMLREIYQANPDHKKTLYYLAMVNMRNGQYDQAEERMERLVDLQPENAFNHYYLGQIYLNQGKKEEAYESAKNYRDRVEDPSLKAQAEELINRIEGTL